MLFKKLLLLTLLLLMCKETYAAITHNSLTHSKSTTDATSYDTASITPTGNSLVIAYIYSVVDSGVANTPTLTGNNLTWVNIDAIKYGQVEFSVFRAMGASPTGTVVTIDFNSQTQQNCSWSIFEFSGTDTSGTNGSGAVVQSGTAEISTAESSLVTLNAFADTGSVGIGGLFLTNKRTLTVGSGFTQIYQDNYTDYIDVTFGTEYKTNDNSVDWTWSGNTSGYALALEIQEPAASPAVASATTFSTTGTEISLATIT